MTIPTFDRIGKDKVINGSLRILHFAAQKAEKYKFKYLTNNAEKRFFTGLLSALFF